MKSAGPTRETPIEKPVLREMHRLGLPIVKMRLPSAEQNWSGPGLTTGEVETEIAGVPEKPMPPEEPKPARQSRRGKAPAAPQGSRSRYAIDPDLIAAGRLPDKAPEVTSATNRRYQVHFDKLLELAAAGDWDAVRDYQVTGSNSYSKMVARYRLDLLAVHGEA
jgi:hypothetical protein